MGSFDERLMELTRKGDIEKVRWMKKINRIILPSQMRRIQQNDKTVLNELVLPKWVGWDMLYEWAGSKPKMEGRLCILCNERNENGMEFREKYICENCFLKLKNMA